MMYALPLDKPLLLVVSDRLRIEVHMHFTGTPSGRHAFALEDITHPDVQQRLRAAGVPPQQASHFLTQCVFCFFAEDVGLLPQRLFERLVGVQTAAPERLRKQLTERGLDPAKRSQLGANFTDPGTILRLLEPVVQRPLLAEWAGAEGNSGHKARMAAALAKSKKHGDKAWRAAQAVFIEFLEHLKAYRVLDPACGSGNFLYLALKCLKSGDRQALVQARGRFAADWPQLLTVEVTQPLMQLAGD
jgi:hypothetical protein